jgi:hypothetical protein
MTSPLSFFGVVNETYLPPNTVVALIWTSTFSGITPLGPMYCGYTSKVNFAAGLPSRWTSSMSPTRPTWTPL